MSITERFQGWNRISRISYPAFIIFILCLSVVRLFVLWVRTRSLFPDWSLDPLDWFCDEDGLLTTVEGRCSDLVCPDDLELLPDVLDEWFFDVLLRALSGTGGLLLVELDLNLGSRGVSTCAKKIMNRGFCKKKYCSQSCSQSCVAQTIFYNPSRDVWRSYDYIVS